MINRGRVLLLLVLVVVALAAAPIAGPRYAVIALLAIGVATAASWWGARQRR